MAEEPDKENLTEGTLISHLLELRNRLIKAMIACIIALIPCAYFSNDLFTFVARPIQAKLPPGGKLIATGVMSPFITPFKLSMFVAVFIAMPYVLYQVWSFVAPGLYRREKRFAIPLLASSVLLFYTGMAFAYQFVFPLAFHFFAMTTPKGVTMQTDITSYLDFVMQMFFAFGLAFETPVAVVLLVLTGMVSLEKLRANRSYVVVGVFIVAAAVTPPDALSLCVMAGPMYMLYEGGLLMAAMMSKMRKKDAETQEPAPP